MDLHRKIAVGVIRFHLYSVAIKGRLCKVKKHINVNYGHITCNYKISQMVDHIIFTNYYLYTYITITGRRKEKIYKYKKIDQMDRHQVKNINTVIE